MNVNAGRLTQRIQIFKIVQAADEGGYYIPQYEHVHCCWAQISRTSGTEMVKDNADFGEEKVRFLIRWTAAPIDRKMVIRHHGKEYEIEYLNDYGTPGKYLEIWGKRTTKEAG